MNGQELNNDLNDREDLFRAIKTIIQLYTDKSHFVYELLQNAEDSKATKVKFDMFPDRLEVLHNGIPFTQRNLTSIRSVALTTKIEEANAIGKFGVGFKSVFGVCKDVILCCDKNNYKKQNNDGDNYLDYFKYRIEDFRYIKEEKNDIELPDEYTTKYIFPFCVSEDFSGYKTMEILHEGISKRLKKLGTSVLLFMKNIEEISYSVSEISDELDCNGSYLLEKKKIGEKCFKITGIGENVTDDVSYLMYLRPTSYNKDVNIAFACEWDKSGFPVFFPAPEKHICVYFPTDTPSNVKFVVQAPYGTTPNRGGIPNTEENVNLSKELAILLHDAILDIRDRKWLTLDFLNLFPLDNRNDYELLKALHNEMITLINNENILPTTNGNYTSKKNAYIVRGEWIAKLFAHEKLCALVKNQNAEWMPSNLTENRPELGDLYDILTRQISLEILDASKLPALLRENIEFWELVNEKWLVEFYNDLLENQLGMLGKGKLFSTVPFIKTVHGKFVAPYIYNSSTRIYTPNVYIFPKNVTTVKDFNFVDVFIVEQCQNFLDEMGINEPNGYVYLIDELTNNNNDNKITIETEVSQVNRTIKYLKEENHNDAIDEFRNKLPLRYISLNDNEKNKATCASKQLYRGIDKILNISIKEYFSGTTCNIGILDEEFYTQNGITPDNLQILEKLGVKNTVVYSGSDNWSDGANCKNVGDFKRWLNFDYIDNIINCISNGDKKKSLLLFTALKKLEKHLKGEYIRGEYRQDRHPCESIIIERIKPRRWLFDYNGNLIRACDITQNELDTTIYDNVDRYTKIYNILGFKEDQIDTLRTQLENLPETILRQMFNDLSKDKQQQIFESIIKPEEQKDFDPNVDIQSHVFPEENIKDLKRLKETIKNSYNNAPNVSYEYVRRSIRTSRGNDRAHLGFRYKGHCQICQTPNNFWEVAEIFNNPIKEMVEMNLSLCPNCASLYRKLRNDDKIMSVFADNIRNISPEKNVTVPLATDKNVHFTQTHLAEIQEILNLEAKNP